MLARVRVVPPAPGSVARGAEYPLHPAYGRWHAVCNSARREPFKRKEQRANLRDMCRADFLGSMLRAQRDRPREVLERRPNGAARQASLLHGPIPGSRRAEAQNRNPPWTAITP